MIYEHRVCQILLLCHAYNPSFSVKGTGKFFICIPDTSSIYLVYLMISTQSHQDKIAHLKNLSGGAVGGLDPAVSLENGRVGAGGDAGGHGDGGLAGAEGQDEYGEFALVINGHSLVGRL